MNLLQIEINQHKFQLHPLKAIYWPAQKTLICSDVHIGKAEQFRKNGIALPKLVNTNNFWNLSILFDQLKPERWLVLGDLMHSSVNKEWDDLSDFLANYPGISSHLVRGNHELYADSIYRDLNFQVSEVLCENSFCFSHEAKEGLEDGIFNFHGHIHPAVRLRGAAGQSLKLPCFYKTSNKLILPSFGSFTGSHIIKPKKEDGVFVIAGNEVKQI
jgi:DNA ligase-associated metallophosphoesterase